MSQAPYLVSGRIYTSRGTVSGSTVKINSDISTTTDTKGKYVLDLANLSSDYVSGASYTIIAYDEFDNEYKSDTITVSGGSQTKNLTLEPRTKTNEKATPTGYITSTSIRTIGNKPISQENLFLVQNSERQLTQKMSYTTSGMTEYVGEAPPGTPTSEPHWRIKKLTYTGTNVTSINWASGNNLFDKVWGSKASYSYS